MQLLIDLISLKLFGFLYKGLTIINPVLFPSNIKLHRRGKTTKTITTVLHNAGEKGKLIFPITFPPFFLEKKSFKIISRNQSSMFFFVLLFVWSFRSELLKINERMNFFFVGSYTRWFVVVNIALASQFLNLFNSLFFLSF